MTEERGRSQRKFIVFITIFQAVAVALFCIFVRYNEVIDAKSHDNDTYTGHDEVMDTQYHMIMDIQVMLFVGFGFLMTFLRRFGYSAVCFTMLLTTMCVEYAVLIKGFTDIDEDNTIKIDWIDLLDGGFAAATVLISFGVVIGKTTPMQLLGMAIIEVPLFVANNYIGYTLLGAVDIGGSIFIHTFGAYFGLFVSLMDRRRDFDNPTASNRSGSDHTSDLFSILGTLMLLIYWPSFNGILAANGDGKHRASFNTYISLSASTMTTFLFSAFLGDEMKMNIVDAQNACLSGGVAVGAIADLMMQPYGAILIGSAAGIISTVGYQVIQEWLQNWLNLHDSCGVNNLHGLPGILSSLLSALYSGLASKEIYGEKLTVYFPALAEEGYTAYDQAMAQLLALAISMAISILGGIVTGFIINNDWLFHRLSDHQLFEDGYFFNLSSFDDGFEGSIITEPPYPMINGKFHTSPDGDDQFPTINIRRVSSRVGDVAKDFTDSDENIVNHGKRRDSSPIYTIEGNHANHEQHRKMSTLNTMAW